MTRSHGSPTAARLSIGSTAVLLLVAALAATPAGASRAAPAQADGLDRLPIVFVHGFAGSANQFEAQALRFASNGWPEDHIVAHEYDSQFGIETREEVLERLDERIDDLLADTGADQVDVLGHSLGTMVMQEYLTSDPARAGRVAHYVNLDGRPADEPPGGVDTLAVWGLGDPAREITGAENVSFDEQSHTEVVTSPETFEAVHRFFTGEDPATTDVVAVDPGEVVLSGRVLYFISNAGVDQGRLDVHEVDPATGERLADEPDATYPLGGDGSWGPFEADGTAHYEFVLSGSSDRSHHWYRSPSPRSNAHLRMLTSEPGGIVDGLWEQSDDHMNLVIIRNKEWWGDQDENDALEVDGTDVISETTTPQDQRIIAVFVTDDGVDGERSVDEPIAAFGALPFLTGVDVPVAAADPPDASVEVTATPRLADEPVTIVVPNWASSGHAVSIQFDDFHTVAPPEAGADVDEDDEGDDAAVAGAGDDGDENGDDGVPWVPIALLVVVGLGIGVAVAVVRGSRT